MNNPPISDEEAKKSLEKLQEMQKTLKEQIEKIHELGGLSPKKLAEFVNIFLSAGYGEKEIHEAEKKLSALEQLLPSLKDEAKEKKGAAASPKKKKPQRKRWISMQ